MVGATRATRRWRSGGQNAQWMYRLYFCHYVPLSTLIVLNERRHTTENYFKKTTFSCLSVECESRIPQLDSSSHIMWHNLARWKYSEEVRYLPRNFRCSEINKIIIFRWKTLEKNMNLINKNIIALQLNYNVSLVYCYISIYYTRDALSMYKKNTLHYWENLTCSFYYWLLLLTGTLFIYLRLEVGFRSRKDYRKDS